MAGFFKSFGKGLLYIVLFPLLIAAIVFYGAYGLIVFIYQFIKMIVLFFSGKTLTSDTEEDLKVKAILGNGTTEEKEEEEEEEIEKVSVYPSESPVYTSTPYNTTTDDKKTEEKVEEKEEEIEVKLDD